MSIHPRNGSCAWFKEAGVVPIFNRLVSCGPEGRRRAELPAVEEMAYRLAEDAIDTLQRCPMLRS